MHINMRTKIGTAVIRQLPTQAYVSKAKPRPQHFQPVKNEGFGWMKPARRTGMWTSTADGDTCSWLEWCKDNDFDYPPNAPMWLLEPKRSLRLLMVDDYMDLVYLDREFGADITVLPDYVRRGLDFEAMAAAGYDGMHLTDGGQWATRLSHPLSLYGWDCESTLWFRWAFTSVSAIGEEV